LSIQSAEKNAFFVCDCCWKKTKKQMSAVWKLPEEASNYAKSRPDYPVEVVDKSLAFLREKFQVLIIDKH
jgi:hypothetical protein